MFRQCSDECQVDDFRRKLCQLERMGYHCTLFTEMFGKLLYTLEPPLIKVLLPLDAVGNGGEQRNLILHALHNSTLVNVSIFGALPLITAVTISGARLTSDSVRATWERSDLRCSASSNTVEKVSQILLYLPHNFSNLLRQFFFIILRIMTDKIDLDIFEFFSQFLFNFCCIKQLLGWIAHNYNDQWQL